MKNESLECRICGEIKRTLGGICGTCLMSQTSGLIPEGFMDGILERGMMGIDWGSKEGDATVSAVFAKDSLDVDALEKPRPLSNGEPRKVQVVLTRSCPACGTPYRYSKLRENLCPECNSKRGVDGRLGCSSCRGRGRSLDRGTAFNATCQRCAGAGFFTGYDELEIDILEKREIPPEAGSNIRSFATITRCTLCQGAGTVYDDATMVRDACERCSGIGKLKRTEQVSDLVMGEMIAKFKNPWNPARPVPSDWKRISDTIVVDATGLDQAMKMVIEFLGVNAMGEDYTGPIAVAREENESDGKPRKEEVPRDTGTPRRRIRVLNDE